MIELKAALSITDDFTRPLRRATEAMNSVKRVSQSVSKSVSEMGAAGEVSFGRMSQGSSGLVGRIAGIATAIGGVTLAAKGLQQIFGGAMQQEVDKLTLSALIQDTQKANKLFEMLMQKGLTSVFSDSDFMGAGKAFLPITKDLKEINALLGVTERLGSSNMLEGMTGASFAIREALSGDLVSLQERFNIPRSMLKNAFKGADTVTEKVAALDSVLNKMGYTQKFVNDINQSASAQWQTFTSNIQTALAKTGVAAVEKLKKPLTELNAWLSSGGLDVIKEKGSDFLSGAVTKAIEFVNMIRTNWPSIKQNFAAFKAEMQPIRDAFALILAGAKSIASFIVTNWGAVKETVISLTAGILAFKAGMMALTVIGVVTNLMNAYRAGTLLATLAQYGLNTAMLANPMTWVVAAIAALIAIGVALYRNWDTVKVKALELWATVKEKFSGIKSAIMTALSPVLDFFDRLVAKWNIFKNAVSRFKMPKFSMPSFGNKGKSHHGGLSYVPKNNYAANLHKGEMVLNKVEADKYRNNAGSKSVNVSFAGANFHVRQESDIQKIAYELAKLIEREGVQMA